MNFSWLKRNRALSTSRLKQLLGDQALPSFPNLVVEVLSRLRDPRAPLTEAAELLRNDPGLSMRMLQLANSAAFALRHPVQSVDHAVIMLGRSEVESILLSVAVRQSLPAGSAPGHDETAFWTMGIRRAAIARVLAQQLHPALKSESFTAGLLQDMAVPVLAHKIPEQYGPVLQKAHEEGLCLAEVEQSQFKWDHGMVAGWMCDTWQFPDNLTAAIVAHHHDDPERAPAAVRLVGELLDGEHAEESVERLIQRSIDECNLTETQARKLVAEGLEQAQSAMSLIATKS